MTFDPNTYNTELIDRMTARLHRMQPGDEITHAEIDKIAGGRRWLFQNARNKINCETGALFKSLRGIGYVRIDDAEAYAIGKDIRRRLKNTARTGSRYIMNAVTRSNSMTDDDMIRASAEVGVLNLVTDATHAKAVSSREIEIRAAHHDVGQAARHCLELMRASLRRR